MPSEPTSCDQDCGKNKTFFLSATLPVLYTIEPKDHSLAVCKACFKSQRIKLSLTVSSSGLEEEISFPGPRSNVHPWQTQLLNIFTLLWSKNINTICGSNIVSLNPNE